ncbi:MAG: hypothetical protein ACP5QR_01545 [Rhizomicrobium sp.]
MKGPDAMSTRTSRTEVAFAHPFILDGMDAEQCPGTYTVETEEESLDTVLSPAWRRVQTAIVIMNSSQTEYFSTSPEQLQDALMRDVAQMNLSVPLSIDSRKARRSRARDMRNPLRNRF